MNAEQSVSAESVAVDRQPAHRSAPRGADAVRASLIGAAGSMFAERGPARVTVREIAERAGVNHGLVHHYFGSKDGLLRAVLDELARAAASEIAERGGVASVLLQGGATDQHGRIVAHLMLEGRDPATLQTGFPAVHGLIDHLRRTGMDERTARERAAQATALVLGWQLFEPFLMAASSLDATPDRRSVAEDGVRRLLAG